MGAAENFHSSSSIFPATGKTVTLKSSGDVGVSLAILPFEFFTNGIQYYWKVVLTFNTPNAKLTLKSSGDVGVSLAILPFEFFTNGIQYYWKVVLTFNTPNARLSEGMGC